MSTIVVTVDDQFEQELLNQGIDVYNEICRALPFGEIDIVRIKDSENQ